MVIIDLPATIGPEMRAINRNYVARFVPRVLDLSIDTAEVDLDEEGLEL